VTRAVYLHIGLQKTGTSYLQGILAASREALAEQGLDLVPARRREAFWLMLDVRDRLQPHDGAAAARVLPGLAATLEEAPGSRALVTEESLAPAEDQQIDRLLGALGDREPHVIVTCRDLGRQIPSVWQQSVKSGRRTSLPRYLQRLRAAEGTPDSIWWQKDLPAVLGRWARHVPPERIHVVPVPAVGARPGMLLERYCAVLGIDPDTVDHDAAGPGNPGLKLAPAEVMRLVNRGVPEELKRRDAFGQVGKRFLSVEILGAMDGEPIKVPAAYAGWCREVSRGYVEFVREGGYDVVGDVEDLMPDDSAFVEGGQQVSDAELADVALRALTAVVNRQLAAEIERRDTPPEPELEPPPRRRWLGRPRD
jgi:hypothetical protein